MTKRPTQIIVTSNGEPVPVGKQLVLVCLWNTPGEVTVKVRKNRDDFRLDGPGGDLHVGDRVPKTRWYVHQIELIYPGVRVTLGHSKRIPGKHRA